MKKELLPAFLFLFFLILFPNISKAEININNDILYNDLKGKIILRVEAKGEAYYIHPEKQKMYYLGRPADAFQVMREQGIGITTYNLERIRMPYDCSDYNPNCNVSEENTTFANKQKGKIFLQVEKNGEAWYVDTINSRRHFLGTPVNAFGIMREQGLGISEDDFNKMQNSDWLTYKNEELGFQMDIPKLMENWVCDFKVTPVATFENNIKKTVFISSKYYFEPCDNSVLNTLDMLNNPNIRHKPGWKIEVKDINNDLELNNFIKSRYGQGCGIGEKRLLQQTGVYDVDILGDGKDLGSTLCPLNYGTVLRYYPDKNILVVWDTGQECKFALSNSICNDKYMLESFRFIQ